MNETNEAVDFHNLFKIESDDYEVLIVLSMKEFIIHSAILHSLEDDLNKLYKIDISK